MNTKIIATVSAALLAAAAIAAEREISGSLDVQNVPAEGSVAALKGAPSSAYAESTVEAKLNVNISDKTDAIHFIRDNADPYVVTKAYVIKNARPFVVRNVIRAIVSGAVSSNPVGVESIEYVDGSGVVLVSAEEYRFKDVGNGMSIDEIIATLDKADLPQATGITAGAYFPKYNGAADLLEKLLESGIGYNNMRPTAKTTWFTQGKLNPAQLGGIKVDSGMNALLLRIPGFDLKDALDFMRTVDNPRPEAYMNFKLVELYAENDQKLGVDFQSWKNNDGINFFSVGGKYGINDWGAGTIANNGHRYAEFFNFNPKWNTKYIDFLTTCGKAKVVTSGKILVTSADPAKDWNGTDVFLADGAFHMVLDKILDPSLDSIIPEGAEGKKLKMRKDEMLSDDGLATLLGNYLIDKGNTQNVEGTNSFFDLFVNADVHSNASNVNISMTNVSLIGWEGDGKPRFARSSYSTSIQIGNETKDFVIGGISKVSVVRSVSGIPFLKDIPVLGWLFSTESDAVKKSQYVLIGSIEPAPVDGTLNSDETEVIDGIKSKVERSVKYPITTAGYQQFFLDN